MSDIKPSDLFLVERGNQSAQVKTEDLMSEIRDTDLMLIERDKVSYSVTGKEVKEQLGSSEPGTLSYIAKGDIEKGTPCVVNVDGTVSQVQYRETSSPGELFGSYKSPSSNPPTVYEKTLAFNVPHVLANKTIVEDHLASNSYSDVFFVTVDSDGTADGQFMVETPRTTLSHRISWHYADIHQPSGNLVVGNSDRVYVYSYNANTETFDSTPIVDDFVIKYTPVEGPNKGVDQTAVFGDKYSLRYDVLNDFFWIAIPYFQNWVAFIVFSYDNKTKSVTQIHEQHHNMDSRKDNGIVSDQYGINMNWVSDGIVSYFSGRYGNTYLIQYQTLDWDQDISQIVVGPVHTVNEGGSGATLNALKFYYDPRGFAIHIYKNGRYPFVNLITKNKQNVTSTRVPTNFPKNQSTGSNWDWYRAYDIDSGNVWYYGSISDVSEWNYCHIHDNGTVSNEGDRGYGFSLNRVLAPIGGTKKYNNLFAIKNYGIFLVHYQETTSFGNKLGCDRFFKFASSSLSSNLRINNYVGISKEAYLDGQQAQIITTGGEATTKQTDLKETQIYYVHEDGRMLPYADPSMVVFAGTGKASNKLLVMSLQVLLTLIPDTIHST